MTTPGEPNLDLWQPLKSKLAVIGAPCRSKVGIRCKGYSEPPDRIPAGSYQGTMDAGTHIGPVTAVHVGSKYVAIRVQDWWINVWKMTRSGTRSGVFFAMQVPEDEVHRWTESGWYNTD